MEKKLDYKKVVVSLLVGWITVYFSQYPLIVDNIYNTQFSWFLIFPMLVASAWGFPYVYITGIGGLFFVLPFFQYQEWGIANLLICVLYVVLLVLCGRWGREVKGSRYYLCFIGYLIVYYMLIELLFRSALYLNPVNENYIRFASPIVIRIQTITSVFGIVAYISLVRVLLKLPQVRKLFGLPKLAYSQKNTKMISIVVMVVVAFLSVDGVFESFYFRSRGLHTSLLYNSFGGLIKLPILIAIGCMICDAIILNTMANLEYHEKLMRSEKRYRMIFQKMTDACFEIDKNGKVLKVNAAIESLGLDKERVSGKTITELFGGNEQITELRKKLFEEQHVENIEMKIYMPNAVEYNLLVSGNVMEYENQQLGVVTARNITDYKKEEEKRWEISAVLNAIFESNKDFIWNVDANTYELISYNKVFSTYVYRSFGKEVHVGCRMKDIFPEEDAKVFENYYHQVVMTGDISAEYISPSGEMLNLSFYPVYLKNQIVSIVVFTKDVTAQKKAERELAELNAGLEQTVEDRTRSLHMAYKDLESFSYTLIHELKTPLREIDTYLEIIKEDSFDIILEQSKKDIVSAQKVCVRTLDMVEKMMIYTKAGFMSLNIEKLDLKKMVEECFRSLEQANVDKKMQLIIEELPYLYGDAFLLHVAIMNILSNSIKFAQTRDTIILDVSYYYEHGKLWYLFKDNGVGFDKKRTNNLFELFYRAHNIDEYDGNGVGLALVRRIIERHGGNVTITGRLDEGCTVGFSFSQNNEQLELNGWKPSDL